DFKQALAHYSKAVPILRKTGERDITAATINNMGVAQRRLGQDRQALKSWEEALRIRREIRDHAGIASTLTNLANLASNKGDHKKATAYYEEALALTRKTGNLPVEAQVCFNLAVSLLDQRFID